MYSAWLNRNVARPMINLIQIFLVFREHLYFDDSINFHRVEAMNNDGQFQSAAKIYFIAARGISMFPELAAFQRFRASNRFLRMLQFFLCHYRAGTGLHGAREDETTLHVRK